MPEPQSGVLTTSPHPPYSKTRAVGIEPTLKVLETLVLPLNYARKGMEGEGFEPPNPKERIYSPPRLASSLPFRNSKDIWRETESNRRHMELQSIALPTELPSQIAGAGFEPTTFGL